MVRSSNRIAYADMITIILEIEVFICYQLMSNYMHAPRHHRADWSRTCYCHHRRDGLRNDTWSVDPADWQKMKYKTLKKFFCSKNSLSVAMAGCIYLMVDRLPLNRRLALNTRGLFLYICRISNLSTMVSWSLDFWKANHLEQLACVLCRKVVYIYERPFFHNT